MKLQGLIIASLTVFTAFPVRNFFPRNVGSSKCSLQSKVHKYEETMQKLYIGMKELFSSDLSGEEKRFKNEKRTKYDAMLDEAIAALNAILEQLASCEIDC